MAGPLSNRRHELFAVALAGGATEQAAYEKAGYEGDRGNAARLTANDSVRARVAELQGEVAKEAVFGITAAIQFCVDVINTPVGQVDQNSRLCQEHTVDTIGGSKGGERIVRTKVKMPSKMDAIEKLAKLMGWYREDQTREKEVDALAALLQSIAKR